jgi:hypothetical protein
MRGPATPAERKGVSGSVRPQGVLSLCAGDVTTAVTRRVSLTPWRAAPAKLHLVFEPSLQTCGLANNH